MVHSFDVRVGGCCAADVPVLAGWIGAYDQEIGAAAEVAVAGAGGEHYNIACLYRKLMAVFAAEDEAGVGGGGSQNFVCRGVVVMEVVNPIAPLRRPAVAGEGGLEYRRRVHACDNEGVPIDEDGKGVVVGHPADRK